MEGIADPNAARPRRWAHCRKRRWLIAMQVFCLGLTVVAVVADERTETSDQTTTTAFRHPHRLHSTRHSDPPVHISNQVADLYDENKRRPRAVADNSDSNYRTMRRKEIPVNYRLYDDLLRLDAVANTISLSGSFELYWQDEWLKWNPDSYEGAVEIFLPSSKIWLPELSLYYSVNMASNLVSNNDARVNFTGHVRWYLPYSTESLCSSVDVKFFPFDMQACTLMFGSWAHSNESISYTLYSHNLSLIDFYDNQEWQLDLQRSHISSQEFLYDYLDPPLYWDMILIELVVQRQSFYYVFNLVIPSGIIVIVSVIGFHSPSTSARVRDAKFRLGIMTLMSMSAVSVAIVQEVPKFSLSGNRKSRGSFSGVPLIGLYYFMLLVIVGLSTISTSAFVFLERSFRQTRRVPWFLTWLSYDIGFGYWNSHSSFTCRNSPVDPSAADALLTSNAGQLPQVRVNGFVGEGSGRPSRANRYAQGVALSLLKLIPNEEEQETPDRPQPTDLNACKAHGRQRRTTNESNDSSTYQHTFSNPGAQEPSPPLRRQFRKRLSLAHYDNLLLYQYFGKQIDELSGTIHRIEKSMTGIKQDVNRMIPREDLNERWQIVIRRLELISLGFYMSLFFATTFLFFWHDWYCAIGNSPCGTPNLKCPWIQVQPC